MFQDTFDVMERIGRVKLNRSDRLIAENAARGAESALELLCRVGAKTASALALMSHARVRTAH